MSGLRRVLGGLIGATILLVLAAGLLVVFASMGPQRQVPVAQAPTPSPSQVLPPTPTPQGQKPSVPPPTFTPIPENTPIRIENFGTVPPIANYEASVRDSETAIIGVARKQLPARWNTPDGKRPPIYWGLPHADRVKYGIFTPFVVEVERYLYGALPEREIILAMAGGQVGVDSQTIGTSESSPVFEVGERFLVFLRRYPDPAIRDSALVDGKVFWLPTFKHVITPENRAKNAYRSVDLPLQEVVARIEAAAAASGKR